MKRKPLVSLTLGGMSFSFIPPRFLRRLWKRAAHFSVIVADGESGKPAKEVNAHETKSNIELYRTLSSVYSAVYARSNALAQVPLRVFKRKKSGNAEDLSDTDHPLQRLLSRKPNDFDTPHEIQEATYSFLDLAGSSYWKLEGGKAEDGGEPEEIFVWKSHRVTPIADKRTKIGGYQYESEIGNSIDVPAESVLQFNMFSPIKDFVGQASVDAGRLAAISDLYAIAVNKGFFENGAHLSGVLFDPEGEIEDDELKRQVEEFNRKHLGPAEGGKVRGISGGLEYKETQPTFSEMMFDKLRTVNFQEIIRVLHTPPVMVGSMDGASFANAREQTKVFWTTSGLPMLNRVEQRINHGLSPRYGDGIFVEYDLSTIEALSKDLKAISEVAKTMFERRSLTPHEFRTWIATGVKPTTLLDPVEGGDETFGTMAQVSTNESLDFDEPDDEPSEPAEDEGEAPEEPEGDTESDSFTESLRRFEERASERLGEKRRVIEARSVVHSAITKALAARRRQGTKLFKRISKRMFKDQLDLILSRLEIIVPPAVNAAMLTPTGRGRARSSKAFKKSFEARTLIDLETIFKELETRHAQAFRAMYEALVEAVGVDEMKALGLGLEFSMTSPGIAEFLENQGAKLVKGANKETIRQLGKTLAEGASKGENISALGDRIKSVFKVANRARATMIAETETTKALGYGSLESYRQTGGVIEQKEWQTAGDSEVRGGDPDDEFDHVSADGQKRGINQAYSVSGEALMYPGDSAGSAGNVINCRCANLPVIDAKSFARIEERKDRHPITINERNGGGER